MDRQPLPRLWLRDDIANALMSVYLASTATTLQHSDEAAEFRRGFKAALIAIGLAFGINMEHRLLSDG